MNSGVHTDATVGFSKRVAAAWIDCFVDTTSASPRASRLVQRLFDFMLTEEVPPRVIGDKAYDSDHLDEEFAEQGIEMIAPHRANRKIANFTQDGRPLRRYDRRWTASHG